MIPNRADRATDQNTHLTRVVVAGLLGGLLGLATSMANHGYGLAPAHTSQFLDAAWTWVAIGLVPCFAARRWLRSAVLSATTLWAAVLCYDLADLHYGVYSGLASMDASAPVVTDWLNFGSDLVGYSVVAAFAAAGLASITVVIRRGGVFGLVAQLVVPAYAAHGSYTRVRDAYAVSDHTPALIDTNRAVTAAALAILVLLASGGLIRLLRLSSRARAGTQQPSTNRPPSRPKTRTRTPQRGDALIPKALDGSPRNEDRG